MPEKKHIHIPASRDGRIAVLQGFGFVAGDRDPKMNTDFSGRFMVAECDTKDARSQRDASCGDQIWCVVGDDLNDLVNSALDIILRADDLYDFTFDELKLYEVRENFRTDEFFIAAESGEQALQIADVLLGGTCDDGACAREVCGLPTGFLPGEVVPPENGPAVMKAWVGDTFVDAYVVARDQEEATLRFLAWVQEKEDNSEIGPGDVVVKAIARPADLTERLIDPDDIAWTMSGNENATPSP